MRETLVLVGHGMVGHRLVSELRRLDRAGRWRVVVLAEENYPAYDRMSLSVYLDGKSAQDLSLVDQELLVDPLVELRLGVTARRIDRAARLVYTDQNPVPYHALVLATGSYPFVPQIPGRDLAGCFVYRTIDDLERIRLAARPGRPGVVIGGGLLGLEAANALRLLGMRPQVIESAPHLMPAQLDAHAGAVVGRLVAGLGVRVHCGVGLRAVEPDRDGSVAAVVLANGARIEASLVVFAAGVRPRDDLAASASLARGERGGILVDERCRTADERIWAIGECAALAGRCYGLVAPGYRMAETVVDQLVGPGTARFSGADLSTELRVLGVGAASFGDAHARTAGAVELCYSDHAADTYAKLVLDADGRILLGGILAGDTSAYPVLRPLVGHRLSAPPEQLLTEPVDGSR
jgi:nitrite reductase (NADH) large subunit